MSIAYEDVKNCPARITLDAGQLAFFNELPTDAPSVQSELRCELELGHEGSHAALGQHVETTTWWIQWTLSASEINPYTWCPASSTPHVAHRDDRDCALFDGHPGKHLSGRQAWQEEAA
ncbi:hypothetical protein [Actinoplanes sp. URMC 104]|uniref:hypothetical protein n=1 Tax=Actinoplanes sp. URMC 104 TaxID=3423409 RepID=UPI003F1C5E4B